MKNDPSINLIGGKKTDSKLLASLKKAAGKKMSTKQLKEQRISFVLGNYSFDSEITRAQVSKVLSDHDGTKVA